MGRVRFDADGVGTRDGVRRDGERQEPGGDVGALGGFRRFHRTGARARSTTREGKIPKKPKNPKNPKGLRARLRARVRDRPVRSHHPRAPGRMRRHADHVLGDSPGVGAEGRGRRPATRVFGGVARRRPRGTLPGCSGRFRKPTFRGRYLRRGRVVGRLVPRAPPTWDARAARRRRVHPVVDHPVVDEPVATRSRGILIVVVVPRRGRGDGLRGELARRVRARHALLRRRLVVVVVVVGVVGPIQLGRRRRLGSVRRPFRVWFVQARLPPGKRPGGCRHPRGTAT
mmetsp:Transcript_14808/g.64055  ORF Transcript_14808/g.64055 Transcript_14808/m.64055 type:complete len:285 (-) Transcript_14808:284-1138(-)